MSMRAAQSESGIAVPADPFAAMLAQARRWCLALGLVVGVFAGGHAASADYERSELRYQGFYNTVSPAELAEDLGYLAPIRLNWIGDTISGPQDIQAVVTGDVDFGGAFNGSIERLIAIGAPIKAVIGFNGADVTTFNGLYVLDGSPIRSARDLVGKKIGVNTLRAGSEFFLDNYFQKSGLTRAEIDQVTLAVLPPAGQEQALRQAQVDAIAIFGIFEDKAVERGGLHLITTDNQVFGDLTGASYVLTNAFISRYPKTARHFVEATAKAIEWSRTHSREEVLARFRSILERRHRHEDPSIVQYWKSYGINSPGGLLTDHDFDVSIAWYRRNGDAKAGSLKPSDIYTNTFNPYRPTADQ
jgi:ABC-type nitrate/sulfonate/bicarbonate transport system substrate-binding protein